MLSINTITRAIEPGLLFRECLVGFKHRSVYWGVSSQRMIASSPRPRSICQPSRSALSEHSSSGSPARSHRQARVMPPIGMRLARPTPPLSAHTTSSAMPGSASRIQCGVMRSSPVSLNGAGLPCAEPEPRACTPLASPWAVGPSWHCCVRGLDLGPCCLVVNLYAQATTR